MSKYNVIDAGNNVLNLDGPLHEDQARQLADEIEQDFGRETRLVQVEDEDEGDGQS